MHHSSVNLGAPAMNQPAMNQKVTALFAKRPEWFDTESRKTRLE